LTVINAYPSIPVATNTSNNALPVMNVTIEPDHDIIEVSIVVNDVNKSASAIHFPSFASLFFLLALFITFQCGPLAYTIVF
jgi:hypothetical protein